MADSNKKQEKLEARKAQKLERRAEESKAAKKAKKNKIILVTAVVLVFAALISLFVYKEIITSGVVERHTTVISSENYSISKSMMTYFFNVNYQNMASSAAQMGLDTSKSLKSQKFIDGETTWYDYFLDYTNRQANQFLILKEAARLDTEFVLDEHFEEEVESIIDSLKAQATAYGYSDADSFLKRAYGSCVNVSDVEECIRLSLFAEEYATALLERNEYTAEDYEKYFGEHKDEHQYIDYLKYSFDVKKDADNKLDATKVAEKKAHAEALAKTTTVDEFKAYVKNYLTEDKKASLAEGKELDDAALAAIDTQVAGLLTKHATKGAVSPEEVAKVLFDENSKVGTVATKFDEENGSFIVFMRASDITRDDYVLRNAQTIYVTNSKHTDATGAAAFADEIIAKWDASAKDSAAFEELAHQYDEGEHTHGDVVVKKTDANYGEWLYDSARKVGEVGKVSTADGVYIVYYTSDDELKGWEYDVDEKLRNEYYNEQYEAFEDTHWVTVNSEKMATIVPVSLAGSSSSQG